MIESTKLVSKGNFNFNLDVRQVSPRSCRNLIDFTTLITRIEWKNSFQMYSKSTPPFQNTNKVITVS